MTEKVTKEELLAKAKKPSHDAMIMHPYYKGKIGVMSQWGKAACCVCFIGRPP